MNRGLKDTLLKEVDELIGMGEPLAGAQVTMHGGFLVENFHAWLSGCLNLMRMLGKASAPWSYVFKTSNASIPHSEEMVGSLKGLRRALQGDLLVRTEDLIRAEISSDLLDQADHLHEKGYFLAAGVLGRAVLEEHLRKMCERRNCVPVKPKPTLNDFKDALYAAQHLDKLTMKHVEAMAAIGNEAAHNLPSLTTEHVDRLLGDVRQFLVQHSA